MLNALLLWLLLLKIKLKNMFSKLFTATLLVSILGVSCGNSDKPLNKQEEKAVQTQVDKDQAAMDSLEKAIQAKINEVDSVSK